MRPDDRTAGSERGRGRTDGHGVRARGRDRGEFGALPAGAWAAVADPPGRPVRGQDLARVRLHLAEPARRHPHLRLRRDDAGARRRPPGHLHRRAGPGPGSRRLPGHRRAGAGPGAGAAGGPGGGAPSGPGPEAGGARLDDLGDQERGVLAPLPLRLPALPVGGAHLLPGRARLGVRLGDADVPAVAVGLPPVRGRARCPALRGRAAGDLPRLASGDRSGRRDRPGADAARAVPDPGADHGGPAAGDGAAGALAAGEPGVRAGVGPGCGGRHRRGGPAADRAGAARRGAGPAGRAGERTGAGQGQAHGGPGGGGPPGGGGAR